uniref:Photosystem II protein J n=1 Tax=Cyphia schlechteri TaxID=2041121 RepID=A0A291F565_9ASTR|nr:photosystem II protein J [Cyphia schlechteri]YP_009436883.1 photosystem II protein J [Cyphia schlechteri]ATG27235.1 photosystem II protein J [Cyphia schlechteri]ATG27260.1 photosystem II protein J [Cyphia schlechteri]
MKTRIPFWIIATVVALLVIVLLGFFFYGSYFGVGSSL